MRLEHMLPDDIKQAVAERWPLLLPTGCLEYHGQHLPVGCDTIIPLEAALACAAQVPAVVAPPLWYGPTGYAVTGPEEGTLDVNTERFGRYAREVLLTLWQVGFARIVVLQWHQGLDGPQGLALRQAAAEIMFEEALRERGPGWWGRGDYRPEDHVFDRIVFLNMIQPEAAGIAGGDHAGVNETSYMLHLRPDACDMSRLRPEEYRFLATAPQGSAERGKAMFEAIVQGLVARLREMKENVG